MPRRNFWLTNRVVVGLVVFFVAVGLWEFKYKPQYHPFYEQGVARYQAGQYQDAMTEFERAYAIAPNAVDVIMMQGWTNLKLKRYEEARMFFGRALAIDPRLEEARMGSAFVTLETGRGTIDYKTLVKYLGKRSADPNVAILAAGALVREGKNREAAELYLRLSFDRNYGKAARLALNEILGLEGTNDPESMEFSNTPRPQQMKVEYRAADDAMWKLTASGWEKYYVTGVDLGPGSPGFYPAAPPQNAATYAEWIRQAEQMNSNTLRVYTLLPPAFYRAFRHHMEAGGKIKLYQQIWIGDPPDRDLYDPKFVEETKAEIRYVLDAIHGRGDVPLKHARGSGLYTADISSAISGLLLGRELEASTAIQTNIVNAGKQQFNGQYVAVHNANATEVWFAEMLDYMVGYEAEHYNWQHPVAIVNWPPMDPLNHPTEAPNLEEVKYRIRHGEKLEIPKNIDDDNDTASIDEAKFQAKPALYAGIFASYHIYPYYPDFLIFDPTYLNSRDRQGLNPMYGYIKQLRAHIPHPLIITEYGVPNSIGISHFQPYGWHHGGHDEAQQAEIVRQISRSIYDSGCAGGLVFSLVDEWYKHNWLTVDFENPIDRATLWLNELDPEKRYGMIGYRPAKWKLFSDPSSWTAEPELYNGSAAGGTVQRVQASSDEAFVYLRLQGACPGCNGNNRSYAVALNTLPNTAGFRQMPFGDVQIASGANFLLYLGSPGYARLLIADNYNPYRIAPRPGLPNETEIVYRRNYMAAIADHGSFQEMIVETNRRRFGRDGTLYPGQRYSRSVLRYAATEADRSDTLAEWYVDAKTKATIVRIPWGKLYVTDPSSRNAFRGFTQAAEGRNSITMGIEASVFELKQAGPAGNLSAEAVLASLPAAPGGLLQAPKRIGWKPWEKLDVPAYLKKGYSVMQKEFLEQTRETNHTPGGVHTVGGTVADGATRGKAASR